MPWATSSNPRQDDDLCKGGCGYRLPLYTLAILRPDQRNHRAKGYCTYCYRSPSQRKPANPAVQNAPAGG